MENNMNITTAQYVVASDMGDAENSGVIATIDGQEMSVPLDPANRHYAEILKQVAAGTLTVLDAD
tara:strand:+ start:936 stop:1130 length:195 start_codon:yes stop_codon:yes gene_type:complete